MVRVFAQSPVRLWASARLWERGWFIRERCGGSLGLTMRCLHNQCLLPSLAGMLTLLAAGCGGEVTIEQHGAPQPLNVCSCMDTRQAEATTLSDIDERTPCLLCWVHTISASADPQRQNGVCHHAQQRCLAEPGCLAVSSCVGACDGQPGCTDGCLQGAGTEYAHDLYMDWMRCFCTECFDVCNAHDDSVACGAAH